MQEDFCDVTNLAVTEEVSYSSLGRAAPPPALGGVTSKLFGVSQEIGE